MFTSQQRGTRSGRGPAVKPYISSKQYYTILYYTILYYTILYYTILYYTLLYYTILYYTISSKQKTLYFLHKKTAIFCVYAVKPRISSKQKALCFLHKKTAIFRVYALKPRISLCRFALTGRRDFPDMPCMSRVCRNNNASVYWSAARNEERPLITADDPHVNRSSSARRVLDPVDIGFITFVLPRRRPGHLFSSL